MTSMSEATSPTSPINNDFSSPAKVALPRSTSTTGSSTASKSEIYHKVAHGYNLKQAPQRQAAHTPNSILSNRTSATLSLGGDLLGDSFHKGAFLEARRICAIRFEQSSEFGWDTPALCRIPKFAKNELALGKRLGKGRFSNVDEIRGITLQHRSMDGVNSSSSVSEKRSGPASPALPAFHHLSQEAATTTAAEAPASKTPNLPATFKKIPRPTRGYRREDTIAYNNHESRAFMEQHCFRLSGDSRYALKMVRRDVFNNDEESDVITGVCDLAVETSFLSVLNHPNIIKLRGIADMNHPYSASYFLVLDRLNETLQRRILQWKAKEERLYNAWGRFSDRRGRKRLDFFEHRLERAFDLGSAIEYLHKKKVIHRDIKPENIGFDIRDDIKLFDFGMARELNDELKVDEENYRLSLCGSPRYMAPEVWAKLPYNSACDVYSFGIVLYEMIALRRAFHFCSATNSEEFAVHVFQSGERPTVDDIRAPPSIKAVLPFCWSDNPQYRYDMPNVNLVLRRELILLRNGDESKLPDFTRRRSTFIFPQSNTKHREGSSASFAASVESIIAPVSPTLKSKNPKRGTIVNMTPLNLSAHSLNLSRHSGKSSLGA